MTKVINSQTNSANNQRIAKNSLMLYLRMLFIMAVTLFTSRVILNTLGITDYGIYNVVAGFVSMFSMLSSSLSASISRFLTFELGQKNIKRLEIIFSTGINVQITMSLIVLFLGEFIGVWFLNNTMSIPTNRIYAANWVLQFSILSFCINLLSVPYNAVIIAHEKMSVFAFISLLEVSLKLLIVYMITISSIDKLITYSFLTLLVNLILRIIYGVYCKRKFEECKFQMIYDKNVLKEMFSFAGWTFFGNTASLLNTQGVNLLVNIYFGVTVNAARGIATQVDAAVRQFINSFTTAVNPQITKSYATGDLDYMHLLICRSSKFSAFLMLFFVVPIILEADTVLKLWLNIVPEYAVIFLQLTLINTFFDSIFANSLLTAMMATGKIKRYQIIITLCGFSVFPLTWVMFYLGAQPQISYYIYMIVYFLLIFVRLWLLKNLIKMKPSLFINKVLLKCLPVILIAFTVPSILLLFMDNGLLRLISVFSISIPVILVAEFFIGFTQNERTFILNKLLSSVKLKI